MRVCAKFIVMVALVFVFTAISFGEENIRIRRIRIIGNTHTDTELLQHEMNRFFDTNRAYTMNELEKIALQMEAKWENTFWFYRSKVFVVPSADDSGAVNIILEVEEGYPYRFWGGSIFAGFAVDNIGGAGRYLAIELGYNRQTVSYRDHYTLPGPLVYEVHAGNYNWSTIDGMGRHQNIQNVKVETIGGVRLGRQALAGMKIGYHFIFNDRYEYLTQYARPVVFVAFNGKNSRLLPTDGKYFKITGAAYIPQHIYRLRGHSEVYVQLVQPVLTFMSKVGGAMQTENTSGYLFDLSLYGQNGVRGPFHASMLGNMNVHHTAELRWRAAHFHLLGFAELTIEPTMFFDAGMAWRNFGETDHILMGFGPSLRFTFGVPVFLTARLDWGFDPSGNNELFFGVELPY